MRPLKPLVANVCVIAMVLMLLGSVNAEEEEQMTETEFILRPIGMVHKEKAQTTLKLNKKFEPALLGLDGFSHVWVFYWFDRNDTTKKRSTLQVHPKRDRTKPLTGVFACRSPARPNLIGVTLCRVVSVKDNVVEIDKIDAFSNSPILDLKPYIPDGNSAQASIPDWLKDSKKSVEK